MPRHRICNTTTRTTPAEVPTRGGQGLRIASTIRQAPKSMPSRERLPSPARYLHRTPMVRKQVRRHCPAPRPSGRPGVRRASRTSSAQQATHPWSERWWWPAGPADRDHQWAAGSGLGVMPATWPGGSFRARPLPPLLGLPFAGQALGPLWVQLVVTATAAGDPRRRQQDGGPLALAWGRLLPQSHHQQPTQGVRRHKHREVGGETPTLGEVFYHPQAAPPGSCDGSP